MKLLTMFFVLAMVVSASAAEIVKDAATTRCEANLIKGNYCLDSQAEIICQMVSQATVGCAMDMVDMKMAADIFEAVEYCRFPFEDGKLPTR